MQFFFLLNCSCGWFWMWEGLSSQYCRPYMAYFHSKPVKPIVWVRNLKLTIVRLTGMPSDTCSKTSQCCYSVRTNCNQAQIIINFRMWSGISIWLCFLQQVTLPLAVQCWFTTKAAWYTLRPGTKNKQCDCFSVPVGLHPAFVLQGQLWNAS